MKNNQKNNPRKRQPQDRELILNYIVKQVEEGTGKPIYELKVEYSEERLLYIGLQYVTTTKKAICTALDIQIENACRYKRDFEKQGLLVQSADEVLCPYTTNPAHLISTNPNEFERLQESNSNQLRLF